MLYQPRNYFVKSTTTMCSIGIQLKRSPVAIRLVRILRGAITLGVICLIAAVGYNMVSEYRLSDALLTTGFLAATTLAIVYRVINPYGWTLVLAGLGYRTGAAESVQLWLVAESRRWLPGGVWGYASRAVAAGKLGVPVSVASTSIAVELLVTLAAALVVAILGLVFHYNQLSSAYGELFLQQADRIGGLNIVLGAVAGIIGTLVLGYLSRKTLRTKVAGLIGKVKFPAAVEICRPKLVMALAYMVAMAALNGLVNQSLLPLVALGGSVPVLAMIAATGIAWMVGFLAFFSPGGILVRECTLAALLLPWLPYEAGMTLAILSRISQLIAEATLTAAVCLGRQPRVS